MVLDFDVYITDWKNARDIPEIGSFRLSDYVDLILGLWSTRVAITFWLLSARPAVLVITAIAEEDDRDWKPSSITLMGSPIDVEARLNRIFCEKSPYRMVRKKLLAEVPANYSKLGRRVIQDSFNWQVFEYESWAARNCLQRFL